MGVIAALCVLLRPRKWPQYFEIGEDLGGQFGGERDDNDTFPLAQIHKISLSESFLSDKTNGGNSILDNTSFDSRDELLLMLPYQKRTDLKQEEREEEALSMIVMGLGDK